MKFSDFGISPEKRRIIIVSSPEKIDHLKQSTNKVSNIKLTSSVVGASSIVSASSTIASIGSLLGSMTILPIVGPAVVLGVLAFREYGKKTPMENIYPIFDINEVQKAFKFPPQHPVVNTAYAMADIFPNLYVPISSFHSYLKEEKHADFVKLAASLGAKEIFLEYIETEKYKFDLKSDINLAKDIINSDIGIEFGIGKIIREKGILSFSFGINNSGIKEFNSPWITFEPSWENMKRRRIENCLSRISVDFTYSDDFGINADLALILEEAKINIGGKFSKASFERLKYGVEFW